MIALVLAMPVIVWGVPITATALGLSPKAALVFTMPLVLIWLIVGSVGSFMIACPRCGRSVFLRRFMFGAPWPNRACSKCRTDLTCGTAS